MSRNIDKVMEDFFKRFTVNSSTKHTELKLEKDDDAKNQCHIMAYSKSRGSESFSGNVSFLLLESPEGLVLIAVNLPEGISSTVELDEYNITDKDLSPGYLLLAVTLLNLQVKRSDDYLEEFILHQHEDPGYKGHSFQDLAQCFPQIKLFFIDENSPLSGASVQACSKFIFSFLPSTINLPIQDSLEKYRGLFLFEKDIFKDNVFLSLTSNHWKHCFLELYRCLEGAFPIRRVNDLGMELARVSGSDSYFSTSMLLKACSTKLGWKSNERDSLNKLIQELVESGLDTNFLFEINYFSSLKVDKDTGMLIPEKISEKIYALRNQMVHQFQEGQEVSIEASDWPKIIDFMLMAWAVCYKCFEEDFV